MESHPEYTLAVDDQGVVVACGELDVAAVVALRAHLAAPAVRTVDLAGVSFMDSSILAVLVEAHGARASDGGLRVREPSANVRRLLHISGLDTLFEIVDGSTDEGRRVRR